jgi:Flp pilus assembly protein TadG
MRSHLKGQTYAEFALCAVVVLILIFGVVNFSLVVYAYNFVSYAAREGARFAAVHGSSNPPPAHSADITNLISAEGYGLNGGNLKVSTTWNPNNQPGSVVAVQVQYTFNFMIPFVTLPPVNLTSSRQRFASVVAALAGCGKTMSFPLCSI